jgi:hypothetical protein
VIGVGLDRRSYHGRRVGGDWQWSDMGAGTLSSAVAVIAGPGGRLDAFARGDDRNIYHAVYVGGQWTDWVDDVDAGPAKRATILSAPAAISRSPGTFDLFAIGDDRRIFHTYYNGTTWTGWMRDTPDGTFL